ncbi:hypothetical protein CR513_11509, partial [Mucuna pruriens]
MDDIFVTNDDWKEKQISSTPMDSNLQLGNANDNAIMDKDMYGHLSLKLPSFLLALSTQYALDILVETSMIDSKPCDTLMTLTSWAIFEDLDRYSYRKT